MNMLMFILLGIRMILMNFGCRVKLLDRLNKLNRSSIIIKLVFKMKLLVIGCGNIIVKLVRKLKLLLVDLLNKKVCLLILRLHLILILFLVLLLNKFVNVIHVNMIVRVCLLKNLVLNW